MSRRIGVPWEARLPSMMSAVSAWASKWTMPTLPKPWWLGHRGGGGPGDRVVAAEDHGDDAPAGHLADLGPDVVVPDLGLPVGAVGVAVVDDLEPVEDLDAQVEVVGPGLVGLAADGPGPEAGAGPVRGADVERRADDGHVGLPGVELLGLGQERSVAERGQAGVGEVELLAQPGREVPGRFHWRGPRSVLRRRRAVASRKASTLSSSPPTSHSSFSSPRRPPRAGRPRCCSGRP